MPAAALLSSPAGAQIPNSANAVNTNHIADAAGGFAQIPDNAVSSAQIASNSVGAAQLADNAVGTAQLGDNSITLFQNKYVGGATDNFNRALYFTTPIGPRHGWDRSAGDQSSACLFDLHFPAALHHCGTQINAPFNGVGTFNAQRVILNDAISSDHLRFSAIGYQNYYSNIHRGVGELGPGRTYLFDLNDPFYNPGADLGGSHFADNGIDDSNKIPDNGIQARHVGFFLVPNESDVGVILTDLIEANGVEAASFADNAVTRAKFAANVVINSDKLADNGIAASAIANEAITTAKLANGAVSGSDFADNAITRAKLAANFVLNFAKLADNAVFSADFVDGAVVRAKLAEGAVTSADFADGAVTTAKIVDRNVTGAKFADGAVTGAKLAANAVTHAKLVNNVITSAKFADNAVTHDKLVDRAVTTAKLADGAVSSADFADGAVTHAKLVDSVITTAKLADGGVDTADFAENAVTSVQIADRSIMGVDIARGQTITSDHLVEASVNGDTILDASVGEVDLDIKLVADFDVIARTGKLSAEGVLEVATGFADVGILTSASGKTIATLSIGDKLRIKQIIEDFRTLGVVARGSEVFVGLSAGVARHIGGLLGGSALAQQEIGNRTDSLGADWASTSLRGQTNWLNARTTELSDRVDFTHASISRLEAGFEEIDRGIAMAAAISSPLIRKGQRARLEIAMSEFGAKEGLSVGVGFRLTHDTQVSFGVATTQDADEHVMRLGTVTQY